MSYGFLPRKPVSEWPEPKVFKTKVRTSIDVLSSENEYQTFPTIPFSQRIRMCSCEKVNGHKAVQELDRVAAWVCTTCGGVIKFWWLTPKYKEE